MGFVIWLFICVGLLTVFSVPDNVEQACLGNVIGLAGLIILLRLPRVRQRLSEPTLLSLVLLLALLAFGLMLSLAMGRLAQAW